jgi:hypothetical protein
LLCGEPNCSIYKGYYARLLFCPEMEFMGKIVIRTAYCRRRGQHFSLCPDFVLPRLRVSRLSWIRLQEIFVQVKGCVSEAIDEWTDGLGEEFYVPRSTALAWLAYPIPIPP